MNEALATETPTRSVGQLAGKYLTFQLAGDSFGIPVLKVREIIRLTTIRAIPKMPEHVCGVINLRNRIIPVLDLRRRFGLPAHQNYEQTCIVVVQVAAGPGRSVATGLVVDGVEEVAQLAASDIEPTPHFGDCDAAHYLLGMAKVKGVVKALLDIDQAIGSATAAQLALTATQTPAQ
ncbi:MAG: chemotaxis protein CheW [Verrucomicrobiota bacterium]